MPKQELEPTLYFDVPPLRVEVYCCVGFREQTGALCRGLGAKFAAHFFNINELIVKFSRGDRLSTSSFRQEGPGYAFRSGSIRFYGVYSEVRKGVFVLSHSIGKSQQKLAQGDVDEMKRCLASFDAWARKRAES